MDGSSTGLSVSGTSLTLSDDEDVPAVNLSVSPSSVAETADATTVTVTAKFSNTNTYAAAKKVTVSVGGSGTATSGTDYAAVADFDVTIAAGKTKATGTFTLTPKDDTLVEGNETLSVGGSSTGLTVNGASVTLTDDDGEPAINLSVDPSSVAEDAGNTTVTVTAKFSNSSTYAAAKKVTVSVGGSGTATSGTDYAAVTDFDVTIAAGKSSGTATFTLTPTDDTQVEGNETLSVAGSSTGMTVNGTSVTLTDNDGPPVINLSVDQSSVSEGASATTVTVTATFSNSNTYGAAKTVSVTVGDSADSAVSGTDYAAVTAFDVTIAAGKKSGTATFTLTPTDDTVIEGNETLSLSGTSDLTVNGASLTLTDDDGTDITLSASPASVEEGDKATTVTITAETDGDTFTTDRTVRVKVGKVGDSATSGKDYAAVSAFDVTIKKTKTSATGTFTLTPTDDNVIEGDEALTVSGTATDLTVNGTSVTIEDNEEPKIILDIKPFLDTDPDKLPESAGPTRVTVTAGTTGGVFDLDREIHVTVGQDGDSAVFGTDYDTPLRRFHVEIKAQATEGETTFTLTPTDDAIVEGDESLTLKGSAAGLEVTTATITIKDNDTADVPRTAPIQNAVTLSAAPASVAEGAEATTVTVTAAAASSVASALTVTVSVGDSGTATSGTDYEAVDDFIITIAANATSATGTFTLTPTQDTLVEGDETIGVTGSATSLTVNGTSVTLTDDDTDVGAALTLTGARAEEGEGLTFTVTVDKAVPGGFTVLPAYTDGTAHAGVDYTPNAAALSFSGTAHEEHRFTVATIEDPDVEPDETFSVDLAVTTDGGGADAAAASAAIAPAHAIGTIANDDMYKIVVTATIILSADPNSLSETADPVTVELTATAETPIAAARTVQVSVGDPRDSATEGTDYATVDDFDLVIAADATQGTSTFTLAPQPDDLVEGDETITVAGRGPDMDVTPAIITLTDSAIAPTVTMRDSEGIEGEAVTFTVTLSQAVGTDVVLAYATDDETAVAAADYRANHGNPDPPGRHDHGHDHRPDARRHRGGTRRDLPGRGEPARGGKVPGVVPATLTAVGTIVDDDEAPAADRASPLQTPILAGPLAGDDGQCRTGGDRAAGPRPPSSGARATSRCPPPTPAAPVEDQPGARRPGPQPDATPSFRDVLAGSSFVFSLFGDQPGGTSDSGGRRSRAPGLWGGPATP